MKLIPISKANPIYENGLCIFIFGSRGLTFQISTNSFKFNLAIKKYIMQDQSQLNSVYSFVVLPRNIQFVSFIPFTPSTPHYSSPISQPTFGSFCFSSANNHQLYCRQDYSLGPAYSATSIAQPRLPDNPAIDSTHIQFSHAQYPSLLSHSAGNIIPDLDSSIIVQNLPLQGRDVSSVNKKQRIKLSGSVNKEKEQQDKEYVPKPQQRKKEGIKYNENENRNIIPNEINQIFSFIQKYNKSGHLLQKLVNRFPHPPSYSVRRFYLYQSILKGKLGRYANEKSLKLVNELYEPKCESWPEHEQRYYNKLCRVLIRHFLYQDSVFIILTSKRMRREKKLDHLRARRAVAKDIMQILRGF